MTSYVCENPRRRTFASIGNQSSVFELGFRTYSGGFFRGLLIRSNIPFIGCRISVQELGSDRWIRRERNVQNEQGEAVQGLWVEIKTEKLRERLDEAARQIGTRKDALEAGDFSGLSSRYSDEDPDEMPLKRQKKIAERHIARLGDALTQIAFIREHLIEGTYRLDFDDARRLATIHVDLDH